MADKSVPKTHVPKGKEYCDKPGTSCWYGPNDVCCNCGRPKGWRISRLNRGRLDRLKGR